MIWQIAPVFFMLDIPRTLADCQEKLDRTHAESDAN